MLSPVISSPSRFLTGVHLEFPRGFDIAALYRYLMGLMVANRKERDL